MNNLLQSQIYENCKLSLPEGLKDLMSDISREVLRAQPQNLYQFIANYLEALLEVRETLSIACKICNETCECTCEPDLADKLREIGFDEEQLETILEIVEKHLNSESVKEQTLLSKLITKTSIDEMKISVVQEAIQRAFKRNLTKNTMDFKNKIDGKIVKAVQHTVRIYETDKPKSEELFVSTYSKRSLTSLSSTSFSGSYINELSFRPYKAIDTDLANIIEKGHDSFDNKTQSIDNGVPNEDNINVIDEIDSNKEINNEIKTKLTSHTVGINIKHRSIELNTGDDNIDHLNELDELQNNEVDEEIVECFGGIFDNHSTISSVNESLHDDDDNSHDTSHENIHYNSDEEKLDFQ